MIFGALFFAPLTFFKFFVNFCILVEINAIFYIKRSKMHKKAEIKGLCPFIPALRSYVKASAYFKISAKDNSHYRSPQDQFPIALRWSLGSERSRHSLRRKPLLPRRTRTPARLRRYARPWCRRIFRPHRASIRRSRDPRS